MAERSPKTPKKKVASKKVVTRKPKKTVVKKPVRTNTKSTTKKLASEENKVVTIPTDISPRQKAKAQAIRQSIVQDFVPAFYAIAYVSAFCFILIGVSLIATQKYKPQIGQMTAALVCTATDCSQTKDSVSTVEESQTTGESVFVLGANIPAVVDDVTRIPFTVTNAKTVETKLRSLTSGGFVSLNTEDLRNDKYRFTIPGNLASGAYSARVYVSSDTGKGQYTFPAGRFEVLNAAGDSVVSGINLDEQEVPTYKRAYSVTEQTFELDISGDTFTGTEDIRVYGPDSISNVTIYLRPLASLNARILGTPEHAYDRWLLSINTYNIPDGIYELFATGAQNGTSVRTPSQQITVSNSTYSTQYNSNTSNIGDETNEDFTRSDEVVERALQSIESTYENFEQTTTAETEAQKLTREIILSNSTIFDSLFEHYAIAKQTENETLLLETIAHIEQQKETLITDILIDPTVRDLADEIDIELTKQLDQFQGKVDTFEALRKERSKNETALDADGDGISDFDERSLYNTDPELPDTDNDGVLDGIEVIKGFDPLNTTSEAVIRYESPRQTIGVQRPDTLEIQSVTPLIQKHDDDSTVILSVIRGRALPNSFVTLHIFSQPIVVTVKTDADGSFVYTFDQELADGEHEIFATFTDNTGAIMAQSTGFRFIKEAQAFTPLGVEDTEFVTSEPLPETVAQNSFNVVAGLGMLSFGLILLLLGLSLRGNKMTPSSSETQI